MSAGLDDTMRARASHSLHAAAMQMSSVNARCRHVAKGSNVQTSLHTDNTRHALPLGLWQVDQQQGIAEFCIVHPISCVNVTPQ